MINSANDIASVKHSSSSVSHKTSSSSSSTPSSPREQDEKIEVTALLPGQNAVINVTKVRTSPLNKTLSDSQKSISSDKLKQIRKKRDRRKSCSSAVSSHRNAEAKPQEPFYNKAMLSVLQPSTRPQKESNEVAGELPSNLVPPSPIKAGSGRRIVLPKRKQ